MKHRLAALFAFSFFQIATQGLAQTELDTYLVRLSDETLDHGVLWRLEAQPADPRTLPALREAFEKKTAKKERQWIAATLLRLGDKSDRYFDFLASYTRKAVEDRTPFFEKFDAQGQIVRGRFSAEFENWCAQNQREPREVAGVQFGVYLEDVKMLAEVDDPRAIDLFRRGLESPNPGVVAYSVEGLARLQDLASIPMIAKAASRIPSGERTVIAGQLTWYFRPEADQLFERLIPEPARRNHLRSNIQILKADEMKRVLSRRGGTKDK